jgi:hypothetical protein
LSENLLKDYQVNNRKAVKTVVYPITHLKKSFAMFKALDITTDRINAHVVRRQDEGAKNATINRELAALKKCSRLLSALETYHQNHTYRHWKNTMHGKVF